MRFKKVDQTGAGKGKKHCSRISLELLRRKKLVTKPNNKLEPEVVKLHIHLTLD